MGDLPWYYVVLAIIVALWVARKLPKCITTWRRSEQNSIGATKRRADGFDRWNPRPSSVVPVLADGPAADDRRYAAQGEERPVLQWLGAEPRPARRRRRGWADRAASAAGARCGSKPLRGSS